MPRPRAAAVRAMVVAPVLAAVLASAAIGCTGSTGSTGTTSRVGADGGPDVVTVSPGPGRVAGSPAPSGRSSSPGSVLATLAATAGGRSPTAAGVLVALGSATAAAGLGSSRGYAVLDPATGAVLAAARGATGFTPASTAKLLTATAVLARLGPAHRFETRVELAGTSGGVARLVLVGGGDSSFTQAAAGAALSGDAAADPVSDPARLSDLVARTVAALRARDLRDVTVSVDDDLFPGAGARAGAGTAASWPADYVSDGIVGPVDALSLDGGRRVPGSIARVTDPAESAGTAFADALTDAGLAVSDTGDDAGTDTGTDSGTVRVHSLPAAPTIAAVRSPRLVDLVHHLLLASDNDYAETLARQVAVAAGRPAGFAGAATATLAELATLGVGVAGTTLLDGSGLSRGDRIAPLVLARVVALDLRDPRLVVVPRSLPVAGRSGTLAGRFTGAAAGGRGLVVAKTGTLTGVDDLAGYVLTRSAGPLVVVVLADDVPGTAAAQSAIDVLASRLVRCGCHG